MPLGHNPPSDVTIGELWRTLASMSVQIEHLSEKVEDLPARIAFDLAAKYDERITSLETRNAARVAGVEVRVTSLEEWRQETAPQLLVGQERVALLQRLVYGAVSTTLLAVAVAILSSVTRH